MDVTFLTTSFPRFRGDFSGNFVCRYAEHLSRLGCRIRVIAPHDNRVVAEDETCGYSIQHFKYFFPTKYQSLAYQGGFVSRIRNNGLRSLQLPFFLSSFFERL